MFISYKCRHSSIIPCTTIPAWTSSFLLCQTNPSPRNNWKPPQKTFLGPTSLSSRYLLPKRPFIPTFPPVLWLPLVQYDAINKIRNNDNGSLLVLTVCFLLCQVFSCNCTYISQFSRKGKLRLRV